MYNWHWSVITSHWELLLGGLISTVELVFATMATSLVAGLFVAIVGTSPFRSLRSLTAAYIEVFRDTPLLLQLYIVYQITPLLSFKAAYVALTLNLTAFLSEVYRSGLNSVDKGQHEAAMSLGMTDGQVKRRIIVPQAFMRVVPLLGTFWVSLFRDSALASIIGVTELTHAAQRISTLTYRPLEAFTALAIII